MNPREMGLEFDRFRDVQLDVLKFMDETPEPVLAVESPTGTGKSLIAVAHQRASGKRVRILTRTISLMQQYMRDFSDLAVTMKGRGNFPCVWDEAECASAVDAPCTDGEECPVIGMCPYYIQRNVAERHPLVVTSYAYYFAETLFASGVVSQCDTLICDEAHRVRDILDDLLAVTIRHEEWSMLAPVPNENTLMAWHSSAESARVALELSARGDKKWRQKMKRKIARVLAYTTSLDPYLVYQSGADSTVIRPLWPKLRQVPIRADQVVFMSGTLYGGKHFADILDIPESDYRFISLPSPFDIARRPVYIEPVVAMNSRSSEVEYARMAEHIRTIWSRHPTSKGVIHTNSNAQAAALYTALGRKNTILHCGETGDARRRVFDNFRAAPLGYYLISPSAGEGEDFPHDQCRVNIIAKVPYPYLGDPLVSARMNDGPFGKKDYAAQTIQHVCQMIGRAMRSEEDYGFTYVLDSSVLRLLKYNRGLWPQYILDAIVR